MKEKLTFPQLLERHHVKLHRLAEASQVDILDVSAMYLEHPVKRTIAERVLIGFNTLCNTQYTLRNTAIRCEEGSR